MNEMSFNFWLGYGLLWFAIGGLTSVLVWRLWLRNWLYRKWLMSQGDRRNGKGH